MGLEEWGVEIPIKVKKITSDDCFTPNWVMNMFKFYYDPCQPYAIDSDYDDLTGVWLSSQVFVNPPYSDPKPWILKGIRSHQKMNSTIVFLLKHDSSTEWYRLLHEAGARFLMFNGRLNFTGEYTKNCNSVAPFPSLLAVLS